MRKISKALQRKGSLAASLVLCADQLNPDIKWRVRVLTPYIIGPAVLIHRILETDSGSAQSSSAVMRYEFNKELPSR